MGAALDKKGDLSSGSIRCGQLSKHCCEEVDAGEGYHVNTIYAETEKKEEVGFDGDVARPQNLPMVQGQPQPVSLVLQQSFESTSQQPIYISQAPEAAWSQQGSLDFAKENSYQMEVRYTNDAQVRQNELNLLHRQAIALKGAVEGRKKAMKMDPTVTAHYEQELSNLSQRIRELELSLGKAADG
mmetsp:Transcript_73247/g.114681  ORF Transcript_73247/g.114681 Transcript_73247/m.114681 type:complete len:185 (+) Transcript_73247:47-601(+)|eukprot:CAMPEP_0169111784 /NCGR_PEP_ID=MMETSP1015-20121227/27263_1 /TAXON_ID=342587 /ORGANISM="Karlodinium micrum, Strain CCMP2283" /LENGTH=184 /DNA_ID=CAMNT_0009173731 /DNA_START=59 /DNA_END=613 /DNA_ORIENTATION=+